MPDKKPYKVKVTAGDSVVEVEGEEKGVVAIVQALSEVLRSERKPAERTSPSSVVGPSPRAEQIDIRSFFEEKQPSSDVEAAAVAAYYYKYLAPPDQRTDGIDASRLGEAFRMARRPLPARAAYTLVNARNAGYLDSTGESGFYRLNPVGFNLVEHTLGNAEARADKKNFGRRKPAKRIKGAKKVKK